MCEGSAPRWPMVARDAEFHRALAVVEGGAQVRGVALVGESGVGKSTLARTLAEALQSSGRTVRFVLGTAPGRAVPLGAFYRSVAIGEAHEPAVLLAAAHRALEQDDNLVLVVDDAQLLDALSATLLHQLALSGRCRLIVVIRADGADGADGEVPDAVTALWKEGLVLRLRIEAFTRAQTGELARAVLGDAVASRLVDELYRRTAGNPLFLRGLLLAGRENGVLARTELGWQLRGPLRSGDELYDLLDFRLRSLAPEELEVVEVLAVAEVLDWEILREVCDNDALARLERRGLIQLVADGSLLAARLQHPVFGEAALRRAGVVRTRQLNSLLAQQLRQRLAATAPRTGSPDVRTLIRLAQFLVGSDLPPDLDVIIEAAASAVAMSNVVAGEELARFAFDRGGGLAAAMVLAEAISWQDRGAEAEAVLGAFGPDGADELLTERWGCLRAVNLFWSCGRVAAARAVLAEVKDRVESAASPGLATAIEATFAFASGDLPTAISTAMAVCESQVEPEATVWAASAASWALALAGRFPEAARIADAGWRAESGLLRFTIGLAEVMALTAEGDFPAADRVRQRCTALTAGVAQAEAFANSMLGMVSMARGALASACAAFHDSVSVMSQSFPSGWLMLVAAWLTQAEAGRGDCAAAAIALKVCEDANGPQVVVFLPELELARAWERASVGQTTAAQVHALRAAQIARRSGMWAVEMRALHTAVRFGDRSRAARLGELARLLDTPLVGAVAAHARGLADRDGDVLDAAADRFAELGAIALVADAAAQAACEHARTGHRRKELESSARAHWLAGQSGLRTPATEAAARPLPITDREREVARLVAAGLSNRQVADRLSVSMRTVDGHLYRIFAKLDIERRDQLVRLVGMAG